MIVTVELGNRLVQLTLTRGIATSWKPKTLYGRQRRLAWAVNGYGFVLVWYKND